jgi:hypothetical protein
VTAPSEPRAPEGSVGVSIAARQARNPTRSVAESHLGGCPVRREDTTIPMREIGMATKAAMAASHVAIDS